MIFIAEPEYSFGYKSENVRSLKLCIKSNPRDNTIKTFGALFSSSLFSSDSRTFEWGSASLAFYTVKLLISYSCHTTIDT